MFLGKEQLPDFMLYCMVECPNSSGLSLSRIFRMHISLFSHPFVQCILYLSIVASLFSCAGPGATPPENQVATSVAATLTAYPSRTPPPTVTSIPSPTEELPPSPTASLTPTPGPSPTPTAPPLPTADPRFGLDLSRPDYRDPFTMTTTWGGPNNEAARNLITEGVLQATDFLTDSYVWWSTTVPEGRDVYAEVTVEFSTCIGKDSAGLGLRIGGNQYDSGYTLEISCDGHYRVRSFSGGAVSILIDWTPSNELLQGSNQTNLIGFVARGNSLHVTINRAVAGSTEDVSFYSGTFALFSNALETPGLTVKFDDFELWYF